MKEIYTFAYMRNNLGDDLFIKYLIENFPKVKFSIAIRENINFDFISEFDNVNILENKEIDIKKYDAMIYIGGSIFMEFDSEELDRLKKQQDIVEQCYQSNIPFFYINPNFGPYKTKEYLETARNIFEKCDDICFRDLYSYKMFEKISKVRYAPDLLFSLPIPKVKKKKDTVGISMIDLKVKKIKEHEENYYKVLKKSIQYYIQQKKEVILFAFCNYEKDDIAIGNLINILSQEEKKHVKEVYYKGNIDTFIKQYAEMEYMICSRFHAMILSCLLEQEYYVLSYSKKTDNVIEDLELCNDYKRINELNKDDIITLNKFKKTDRKKIEKIRQKSQSHIYAFENFVES